MFTTTVHVYVQGDKYYILLRLYFVLILPPIYIYHANEESYITLASEGEVVSSGEIKEFNCTTIGSSIMAWYSEEYIGVNDLQILSHNRAATVVSSVNNPSTIATRLSSTVENGLPVIVSQLRIVVSSQYQTASVTCRNIATGISRTIEIQISGNDLFNLP